MKIVNYRRTPSTFGINYDVMKVSWFAIESIPDYVSDTPTTHFNFQASELIVKFVENHHKYSISIPPLPPLPLPRPHPPFRRCRFLTYTENFANMVSSYTFIVVAYAYSISPCEMDSTRQPSTR